MCSPGDTGEAAGFKLLSCLLGQMTGVSIPGCRFTNFHS